MSMSTSTPRFRRSLTALLLVVAAVLLGACACTPGGGTGKVIGGPAQAEEPSRVAIPSLGVDSPLMRLGRGDDGAVRVPPPEKGRVAGWYRGSARPGTRGAAVIIGHDATLDGKAVFQDLHRIKEGDVIDVERGDGKILHFTVTGTEKVTESAFPTRKVYGETREKALRLVTCAGNLIVYAKLA
ncbi:sortase domain-containing protein [Streptomyces hesseae]|uniref:Sortase n=1 Tax=Streptomyces hesseae TaxID=3075519 RepID=A0ABU2SRM2_9ACTN|nr:sortase [Streptomyces sp. DSM 40473]MDT0451647.1 sortase [Streptomyces sp. DSM 40473]